VEAFVCPQNTRSIHLLERFNFRREGLLKQRTLWGGKFWDDLSYSLLNAEWRAYQRAMQVRLPARWLVQSGTPATTRHP
jgi:hypothetical protein